MLLEEKADKKIISRPSIRCEQKLQNHRGGQELLNPDRANKGKLHRGDIFELRLVERQGILSRQNGTYKGTEAQKIVCPFMAGV